MRKFVQIDNDIVTACLEGMEIPQVLPPGRVFVEVEEFPKIPASYDKTTNTFKNPKIKPRKPQ